MESVSGNSFDLLNVLPHCNLGSFESNNFSMDPQICKNDKMDIWTLISRQNNILQQQQIQISQLTVHLTALQDLVKSLSSELKALKPTTDTAKLHISSEPVNLNKRYNNEFHPCNLFCHWCKGYYHTYKTCYWRQRKCFRCGSPTHQVSNCHRYINMHNRYQNL